MKRESLRTALHKHLNEYHHLSQDGLEAICKRRGQKVDTARRILEGDKSPNVEKIKNEKGFITGYQIKSNKAYSDGKERPQRVEEYTKPDGTWGVRFVK